MVYSHWIKFVTRQRREVLKRKGNPSIYTIIFYLIVIVIIAYLINLIKRKEFKVINDKPKPPKLPIKNHIYPRFKPF